MSFSFPPSSLFSFFSPFIFPLQSRSSSPPRVEAAAPRSFSPSSCRRPAPPVPALLMDVLVVARPPSPLSSSHAPAASPPRAPAAHRHPRRAPPLPSAAPPPASPRARPGLELVLGRVSPNLWSFPHVLLRSLPAHGRRAPRPPEPCSGRPRPPLPDLARRPPSSPLAVMCMRALPVRVFVAVPCCCCRSPTVVPDAFVLRVPDLMPPSMSLLHVPVPWSFPDGCFRCSRCRVP